MYDTDETIEPRQVNMVLTVPNRLAHILGSFSLLLRKLNFAESMGTDGI